MPHHHHLGEIAVLGAMALGAYELYHLERYGNFGFGNPNHHSTGYGGYSTGYGGYGTGYGFGDQMLGDPTYINPTFGYPPRHHHHTF
jgi:hypothetical protein